MVFSPDCISFTMHLALFFGPVLLIYLSGSPPPRRTDYPGGDNTVFQIGPGRHCQRSISFPEFSGPGQARVPRIIYEIP